MNRLVICGWLALGLAHGADNTLTAEEKKAGWRLLFDGKSMNGWLDPAKKNVPGNAWKVEDGTLKTVKGVAIREDLMTRESFGDFELAFDWRVAPGGNTGVKYRIQDTLFIDESRNNKGRFEEVVGREYAEHPSDRSKFAAPATAQEYVVAFEMQLIDDARHPDARRDARHTTGALYSMIAPQAQAARPAGEWNTGRVVVRGLAFEHWINGTKVLAGRLDAEAVRAGVQKRWGPAPRVREQLTNPRPSAPVGLQHHGDEVWFRNLKLRPLR